MRSRIERLFFWVCLGLYWGFIAANAASASQLRVLTLNFNSEDVRNDSHEIIRDRRFMGLTHWIRKHDPDIILIQEGWNYRSDPSVAITLARQLGYDLAYRLDMGFPGYFLDSDAILAKKSLQMSGERDIKLPHSATEIGNGKTWVIGFGRVTWTVGVKLVLPSGNPLYVYTSHLIGANLSQRADQLRAIDADIRARAKQDGIDWTQARVILGGDFNSEPGDPGPRFLTASGYVDSFATVHPGDGSCTNCSDPTLPWFNPMTIGAGLVPSQTNETGSQRYDYVFSHGPGLIPQASTLVFTLPYNGAWMSDHYGVFSIFGDQSSPGIPDPVHDRQDRFEKSRIITLTDADFLCTDPWGYDEIPDNGCDLDLGAQVVNGPRGVTIVNHSDFYVEIHLSGPGNIFSSPNASLNPGDSAAFSFDTPGSFNYSVSNTVQSPNPYRARGYGTIQVLNTGY